MKMTPKFYALTIVAMGLAAAASVAAANLTIDPQAMFRAESRASVRNYNDRYYRYLDYRKQQNDIQGLAFSSSRGAGIPLEVLANHTGARFANFSVTAGLVTDHLAVLQRAVEDKRHTAAPITHVFLMLDIDLFGMPPQTNRSLSSHLHYDLTGEDPIRFWLRYLTTVQFRAWQAAMRGAQSGRGTTATPAPPQIRLASLGEFFIPMQRPNVLERPTGRPGYPSQLAMLRRFVGICRAERIDLTIAISPLHRAVADKLDMDDRERLVEHISQIVPVWDFGAPAWLSDRADLWADLGHFHTNVGGMMLDRIYAGTRLDGDPSFGALRAGRAD